MKKKTKYPIANGTTIYYIDTKGHSKIGTAKKMRLLGGKASFLVVNATNAVKGGEWIGEEQFR